MRQAKALLLLRIVLMVEMACVLGFVMTRGKGFSFGGVDASDLFRVGAFAGFFVWLLGMIGLQVASLRSSKRKAAKTDPFEE